MRVICKNIQDDIVTALKQLQFNSQMPKIKAERETHALTHVWWRELYILFYMISENSGSMSFQGLCFYSYRILHYMISENSGSVSFQGLCFYSYRILHSLGAGQWQWKERNFQTVKPHWISYKPLWIRGYFFLSPSLLSYASPLVRNHPGNCGSAVPPWGLGSLSASPWRRAKAVRPSTWG